MPLIVLKRYLLNTLCPIRLSVSALDSSPLPIDLALIKTHCAIDTTDFDTLLTTYLLAAIAWAEGTTHRTIFSRAHIWTLRQFPYCDYYQEIPLPRGKTQSVESIQYVVNGQTLTLTGSSSSPVATGYQEDLRGDDGGTLRPAFGSTWPSVDYDAPAPVTINFTAGWLSNEVPSDVVHALLFAVSDAFETRSTADMSQGRNFDVREALISPYRLSRLY